METNRLFRIAEGSGTSVDFADLSRNRAFCIVVGGKKYIAVDKRVAPESREERVLLAHELGHLKTESLYSPDTPPLIRRRFEKKADGWAINALVPLPRLREAVRSGYESIPALAEYFSVTEEFMQKALKYYSEQKSVV